ncbi:MFS transporter [Egicoccus halophilus]|uniref:MFS transporter n=1 Tax=Egicoccus halophilus TaxID=1670830 RepID=A0A8J3EW14_9ACTN|nr:MFS transporter [Egicoccus halophilus]GGI02383.1 MFS transporter [Egicoccus halophilus]
MPAPVLQGGGGGRGALAGSLALAMGVAPLANLSIAALSPLIVTDLGISTAQVGLLLVIPHLFTATIAAQGGRLTDRWGPRHSLLVLFAFGGGAVLATGLAPTFLWMAVALSLSGAAQSLSNPATNHAVVSYLPAGQRGHTLGIKQSGVQLCQFLVGACLPSVAVWYGWRTAIMSSAVLAGIGAVLTIRVLPATPRTESSRRLPRRDRPPPTPLPDFVRWLTAYALLIGCGVQATNAYLPLYAFSDIGFDPVAAGATAGALGGLGMAARVVWGRWSEQLDAPSSLLFIACGALVGVLALLGARHTWWLIWVGVSVHSFTALAANVVIMMTLVRRIRAGDLGRASGVLSIGMYVGFTSGPLLFGLIADLRASYVPSWAFLIIVYVLAILTAAHGRRRARPVLTG